MQKNKKCPVCNYAIKDEKHSAKIGGKTVYTCCDDCTEKLKANPDKYLAAK